MLFSITHALAKISWAPSAAVICGSLPVAFTIACTGSALITPATYLSDIVPRSWRYRPLESGLYMFQQLVNLLLEHFNTVEIVWHGDRLPDKQENVILLSNHQCTMDWMLIGMLASRQGSAQSVRFLLKDSLKYVPVAGGYLNLIGCVYIKRGSGNFEVIRRRLGQFVADKRPLWWVVFPEGTRYDVTKPHLLRASQDFSGERGLPNLKYLLQPKTRGFEVSVDALQGHCQAVYDMTVAYTPRHQIRGSQGCAPAPSMADFAAGQCSRVDIHVQRIEMDCLPKDSEGCKEWLRNQFLIKDRMLANFYNRKTGPLAENGYRRPLSLGRTLFAAAPLLIGVSLYAHPQGRQVNLLVLLAASSAALVGCFI